MVEEKKFQGQTVEEKVEDVINIMKARNNLRGCRYLGEAITIASKRQESIYDITREIYEKIALKASKRKQSVIAAISYLIQSVCDSGELESLNEYVGNELYKNDVRPTNAEFIAKISQKIRSELNL